MSSLNAGEKRLFERLFGMSTGYVLNFSDATFGEFFLDNADVDIHSERYKLSGGSKAKKLRAFWKVESDPLVGTVLFALLEHWEQINLPPSPDDSLLAGQCRGIANRLLAGGPSLVTLKETAIVFDARHLADQIRRMERSIETDPALAIGTAKEIIETCCKTILGERKKPFEGKPDIQVLTKAVLKELKLVPEGVPENAKGAKTIKVLLSNLATIVQGLAELRGLYGTGHGKDGRTKGLTPRHSKLAVGAATTLVNFLFDTHKENA